MASKKIKANRMAGNKKALAKAPKSAMRVRAEAIKGAIGRAAASKSAVRKPAVRTSSIRTASVRAASVSKSGLGKSAAGKARANQPGDGKAGVSQPAAGKAGVSQPAKSQPAAGQGAARKVAPRKVGISNGSALPEYFRKTDEERAFGLFGIVGEDGEYDKAALSWLEPELALTLYRGMLTVRIMDQRLIAIQRQGLISFYGEAVGQEAATIGSAAALLPQDWLVPALREAGAGIFRGLSLKDYVAQIFGNNNDVTKGRQMPCHPCDKANNYVNMSSCVGTQIPHAVGIAMAMQRSGAGDQICMGFMGDGGTSEPDFHVSMTFAGVQKPPVVLVCQNNQWAISTPGTLQTAAPTIACKALGYGVRPYRADGNDVFAVYQTAKIAADRARSGQGPSFIEFLTYRVSAHTSSDDPSRYRDESVTKVWREKKDPLLRAERFLLGRSWITEKEIAQKREELESEVRNVIASEQSVAMPALPTLIEDVYEQPTWVLKEQLSALARVSN